MTKYTSLKLLDPGTATNNQHLRYNATTGLWEPSRGFRTIISSPNVKKEIFGVTEQVVCSTVIPANTFTTGSIVRFKFLSCFTTGSSTWNVQTFRVRIGTTSLAGAIPIVYAWEPSNKGPETWKYKLGHGQLTFSAHGASGAALGQMSMTEAYNIYQADGTAGAPVTINTTVDNLLEFTLNANHSTIVTYQFYGCHFELCI